MNLINNDGDQRSQILDFLRSVETAVIATSAGKEIRLRVMHLGVDDDMSIYLATMHNDPKVMQLVHNPTVTVLASRQDGPVTEAMEVEYTGRAVLLKDADSRQRCLEVTGKTSPVVQSLVSIGQSGVLDCLKIVPTRLKYRKFSEIVQGMPPTVIEMTENERVESDLQVLQAKARAWWLAIRFNSLTASFVAVVLGGAISFYQAGQVNPWLLLLTLLAAMAVQAGTNVLNDYWDHHSGTDHANRHYIRPFSGGSRVIQMGLLTPLEMLAGGSLLCLLALVGGFYLAVQSGPAVYLLMLVGLATGVWYNSAGPNLIKLGLGEFTVGLNFGVLLIIGTVYVQSGALNWEALLAAVPVALMIAAVIYINEFPDAEADARVGKTTLIVRWGLRRAAFNLKWFFALAYLMLVLGILLGYLPWWSAVALLPAPLAVRASIHAVKNYHNMVDLAPANGWTATAHLATGLFLALGYIGAALGIAGLAYTISIGVVFVLIILWMNRYIERLRLAAVTLKERFN